MGDLYELIIRIVDDRLKQKDKTENTLLVGESHVSFSGSQGRATDKEETLLQALSQQIIVLVDIQRQLLETVQMGQQRIEALLNEFLNMMRQQAEVSVINSSHPSSRSWREAESDSERNPERESGLRKPSEKHTGPRSDETNENPSNGYALMSPPDLIDEEVSYLPSDNWLEEVSLKPSTNDLMPDGVSIPTASASPPKTDVLTDQLPDYLRKLFGIEVDYIRARQTPSSPSLQNAQVLVGEGTYNGQLVTLTIFGKSHITPTDVTIFYNAVVRPLRGSVTEPVLSVVFGESFEVKALKVAHALDLLVVNLKDLMEISGGTV